MGMSLLEVAIVPEMSPVMPLFSSASLDSAPTSERLQLPLAEIVKSLTSQLDQVAERAIDCESAESFIVIRDQLLKRYVDLSQALSHVIFAELDKTALTSIADLVLEMLRERFTTFGEPYFGSEACGEILFSLSTLRTVYRWVGEAAITPIESINFQKDLELAQKAFTNLTITNFCLQALLMAIRRHKRLPCYLFNQFTEGLRGSVMAYSYVRAALDLRKVLDKRYEEELQVSWDEEDEALANAW